MWNGTCALFVCLPFNIKINDIPIKTRVSFVPSDSIDRRAFHGRGAATNLTNRFRFHVSVARLHDTMPQRRHACSRYREESKFWAAVEWAACNPQVRMAEKDKQCWNIAKSRWSGGRGGRTTRKTTVDFMRTLANALPPEQWVLCTFTFLSHFTWDNGTEKIILAGRWRCRRRRRPDWKCSGERRRKAFICA